jgi:peroxiredoxin (alkyl hydroperoxide reductase subunit C)
MEDVKFVLPLLGDKFPEMHVKTTFGSISLPNEYQGKWFVLFSHPGDFTPVCTTEFYEFARRADEFKAVNTELIGLSVDQVQSHLKWVHWIKDNLDQEIVFPVIADELGLVAKRLGMIHEGKGTNTVRAVFIVDPKGYLRLMMYYPQEIGRSVDEVLRSVKALQISDENHVACAENYPNNSLIGAKVIIPPASSEEMIKERERAIAANELESYDWWLCYRNL